MLYNKMNILKEVTYMKKVFAYLKKELMLTVSVLAAVIALFITPPSVQLLKDIDWHTLAMLFMMLTVLEGFKKENIFRPLLKLTQKIGTLTGLSFFLIFSVFFSSMFVTNDVSLIIFVPLTILLFRAGDKEKYILPVISMENIAAVRGSMLTPFGSPQNLFSSVSWVCRLVNSYFTCCPCGFFRQYFSVDLSASFTERT